MAKNTVSAARFIEELKKRGGSEKRSELLLRWKNGAITAEHLDVLIAETGCTVVTERTRGRPRIVVSLPLTPSP